MLLGKRTISLGERTLIMGILNVTPDSFSDGGRYDSLGAALLQAHRMQEEGADIIDLGGESTRPGYRPVSVEEELNRVMPVIAALKRDGSFTTPLSIDTSKAAVALRALEAGVEMVNDIWGLKADPDIAPLIAGFKASVCLMHNRSHACYGNLVADILSDLQQSIDLALSAGISRQSVMVDPGIGFGKDLQHNLELMSRLGELHALGYPLLLGTSRKSMIGKTLGLPVGERLEGTAATVALGIAQGVDLVRVHDVKAMLRVARMTDAIVRRCTDGPPDH